MKLYWVSACFQELYLKHQTITPKRVARYQDPFLLPQWVPEGDPPGQASWLSLLLSTIFGQCGIEKVWVGC